jgi:hypothetical protein
MPPMASNKVEAPEKKDEGTKKDAKDEEKEAQDLVRHLQMTCKMVCSFLSLFPCSPKRISN